MRNDLKPILLLFIVSLGVILGVGAALAYERLGGWHGATHQARLAYLAHVSPLMWPREPFTRGSWARTPVQARYRLAKSLLAEGRLIGRTHDEVGGLLGGSIPPDRKQWLYELRRADYQNLWWVLVIEFDGDRVVAARRDIAWLDP